MTLLVLMAYLELIRFDVLLTRGTFKRCTTPCATTRLVHNRQPANLSSEFVRLLIWPASGIGKRRSACNGPPLRRACSSDTASLLKWSSVHSRFRSEPMLGSR